ncbi:hypothetical protein COCON_G00130580 [Conger conger]|uniref:Sema domain-containing protein n=1 Tax=Conger conger TaxID=82655 RepID=A0A9Q1DDX1_CONCO|nr:hypothetical protein COCON_G00130580 [Conger conger]
MALWRLAWVVMAMLPACPCRLVPRVSFSAGSPGRLLTVFTNPNITNTTTLLLGKDGETLVVGARDAVISLDVGRPGVMEMKSKVDWFPSSEDLEHCSVKGQKTKDCHNFIRVLQFLNSTHMYACGTFAFSPQCAYIDSRDFALTYGPSGEPDTGRGRCPYNPYQRNTAITVYGELYVSGVADYLGIRPVISRYLSKGSRDLKLDDTPGLLDEPTFISSAFIPSEEKVYFFFREVGGEYDFFEKLIVPRIAQVCTSDMGGQRTLQKRWTTFVKAQLLCQATNELPYNILQDVVTLPPPEGATDDETLFYGIFGSQWPGGNSGKSAVCAFQLRDVKKVFSGNYKVLNRDTLRWSTRLQEKEANPGECGLHNASDSTLRFVKENFLADLGVPPHGKAPALVSADHRYRRIAVQTTRGADGRDYTVLFLLTESGFLQKVVLLDQGPHIIEEVQVFQQPQAVSNLLLSVSKGVVFVGTSHGVVRVPVSNCSYYWSCAECVLSRDPFCAWDPHRQACAEVSSIPADASQDVAGVNVAGMCSEATITPRARSGQPRTPTEEEVLVSLNEVVTLRCPGTSRLASLLWEGPSGPLAPELYLQRDDGRLSFLASALTLGPHRCYSLESGHQQALALYAVTQRDAPAGGPAQTPTPGAAPTGGVTPSAPARQPGGGPAAETTSEAPSHTAAPEPTTGSRAPVPAATRNPSAAERPGPAPDPPQGRSYYEELVAVSVLLALALCALTAGALCWLRQRCRRKAAPQVYPRRASEADVPQEHDPLAPTPPNCSRASLRSPWRTAR